MKTIIFTDDMKLNLAERLVTAGIPVTYFSSFLGMSAEKIYYRLRGVRQEERFFKKKKSITRLERAIQLLEEGVPLDLVAFITETSGSQILSWLVEE